jgi:hypothetical protein
LVVSGRPVDTPAYDASERSRVHLGLDGYGYARYAGVFFKFFFREDLEKAFPQVSGPEEERKPSFER